jgi:hypothetical protein
MISRFKQWALSIPGWHTTRKIVIFESDDWGSLRVSSDIVFNRLVSAGLDLTTGDSYRYNRYDALETTDDLDALFTTLSSFKDARGNHPVFTAFCLVANPAFEKIESNKFQTYNYERVDSTFEQYYGNNLVDLWRNGERSNIFVPEFHGREHLNVAQWLKALQANEFQARTAFKHRVWGYTNRNQFNISFQAAFDVGTSEEVSIHRKIVTDGLNCFEELMGYPASAFVPPNGIMHKDLYQVSAMAGIKYIFSAQRNALAVGQGRHKIVWNYLGKRNDAKQIFIIRNAFFEPSDPGRNWVKTCVSEIQSAFDAKRPAIIGSHRVNYIGSRDRENQQRGLSQLSELLTQILAKWPDIEFMSTRQLGKLIELE